ncbi:hypothetical protein AK812_SmicGene42742 [Symbiodinium microadriaticum]|uniref:Uncharacterized protein n=1 Tax=Symbiodinium microadriaticum TaxID=2951 RepID=A0A1Q9C2T3_SYMMI|nr:hypothetical protein AK812_SmicGene42742 [Symbiodinium microadriaticum]
MAFSWSWWLPSLDIFSYCQCQDEITVEPTVAKAGRLENIGEATDATEDAVSHSLEDLGPGLMQCIGSHLGDALLKIIASMCDPEIRPEVYLLSQCAPKDLAQRLHGADYHLREGCKGY